MEVIICIVNYILTNLSNLHSGISCIFVTFSFAAFSFISLFQSSIILCIKVSDYYRFIIYYTFYQFNNIFFFHIMLCLDLSFYCY